MTKKKIDIQNKPLGKDYKPIVEMAVYKMTIAEPSYFFPNPVYIGMTKKFKKVGNLKTRMEDHINYVWKVWDWLAVMDFTAKSRLEVLCDEYIKEGIESVFTYEFTYIAMCLHLLLLDKTPYDIEYEVIDTHTFRSEECKTRNVLLKMEELELEQILKENSDISGFNSPMTERNRLFSKSQWPRPMCRNDYEDVKKIISNEERALEKLESARENNTISAIGAAYLEGDKRKVALDLHKFFLTIVEGGMHGAKLRTRSQMEKEIERAEKEKEKEEMLRKSFEKIDAINALRETEEEQKKMTTQEAKEFLDSLLMQDRQNQHQDD